MSPQQRKLIVMYADVSGSARLFERLGDTEAMHAVDRCLKRMQRSIESYRGRTVQIVGDELLATFEAAEDGCQAAIDMQQRISDLPPVSGLKLTIRIGLHSGEVEESTNDLVGDAVSSTARIVGIARRDQILTSSRLVSELNQHALVNVQPMPRLGVIKENVEELKLFQIEWASLVASGNISSFSIMPVDRLCVRYGSNAYLLDDKMPVLTLGRDLTNKLHIEDRKVSRTHARIEKRPSGYYLVDTSTNGTFVSSAGRQEVLVRRNEILLDGKGRLCFGASRNDPAAETADFEHL